MVAIAFAALCGFGALAFDIGHMVMVKAELQRTADAAALAGARSFAPYAGSGTSQHPTGLMGKVKPMK